MKLYARLKEGINEKVVSLRIINQRWKKHLGKRSGTKGPRSKKKLGLKGKRKMRNTEDRVFEL